MLALRQTGFGACGSDSFVDNLGVTESVGLFKGRVIAASAGVVFLVSVRCARCRNCIVVNKVMTERVDCHVSSRNLVAADGAVDNAVIAARFGACRFDSVFFNSIKGRMTVCIYPFVFYFFAAVRTLKGRVALFGAGGRGNRAVLRKIVNEHVNGVFDKFNGSVFLRCNLCAEIAEVFNGECGKFVF